MADEWWVDLKKVGVAGARHLNGHSKHIATLKFGPEGIRWSLGLKIPWEGVRTVEVNEETGRAKVPVAVAALSLGVAAAAKRKKRGSHITIITDQAEHGFLTLYVPPEQVRTLLRPVLDHVGPDALPTPSAPLAPSAADELKKLAELRDQGVLTEDEFAAAKARLLG